LGFLTFEVLIGWHFYTACQVFTSSKSSFVKPAGGGELGVYHEEGWMPGKNAVTGSLKKRVSLPGSEVDGLWLPVSHRPATPEVTVPECVDDALGEILQPQRNCVALPIRDANGVSRY
jgi:hypothetical protein